jgi:hypothetical protein
MQALSLAKECYSQKLDLLTNSSVINDSMRFIEKSKKEIINQENDIQGSTKNNQTGESTNNNNTVF